MNQKSGSLFIVVILLTGDSRVTEKAAALAGTKIAAKHRATISETTKLLNLRFENEYFIRFFVQSPNKSSLP